MLTAWPWADNDKQLRDAKFKLELSPGALSEIQWLRQSSKKLKKKHASMVLLDIQNGLINLRPIKNSTSLVSSTDNSPSSPINTQSGACRSGGDDDIGSVDGDDNDERNDGNDDDNQDNDQGEF